MGQDLRIRIGSTSTTATIYAATECSVKISTADTEINHKDNYSNGWTEGKPTVNSWTMDTGGLVFFDESVTVADLLAHQIGKVELFIDFTTGVSGDVKMSGKCYIVDQEIAAPNGEISTYKVSFKGTGPLTPSTVA